MIHRSPYPNPRIPDVPLHRYVLEHAARYGDKPALVDAERGTTLSYTQLATAVATAAARLRACGLRAGHTIALVGPNRPEWAVAFFGALEAQAVVHPVNPALTRDEIARQLRQVGARLVLAADGVLTRACEAAEAAASPQVLKLSVLTSEAHESGAARRASGDAAGPARLPAVLASSSGTTGLPKAVVLRHRNLVANLEQHRPVQRIAEDDVVSAVLPFFHIYGLTLVLSCALRHGATVVTLPRFDLEAFLSSIERHRVTRLYLAPPIVNALASAPEVDARDLSSLRVATCGAAPLDAAAAQRASARIGCPILQGYGMTEASPGTHYTPEDRIDAVPTASVGYLLAGTEARIIADGDASAPARDADPETGGELWVRGPQIMQGYLDAPGATAECLTEDGWLRTGDVVRRDATGAFFVVDRLKELIKYKGHQVAPAELEALLRRHPDIHDAAVVGLPDPAAGEIPAAYVVSDGAIDTHALMAWVAERVAPHKKIRAIERIPRIPRSPAGKILRRVLRAQGGAFALRK